MNQLYQVLGHTPNDRRILADRHTNSTVPITTFSSREEVDARREELRFNLRMAAGLYPWPEKTPLNPRYELVGKYDGYVVKKVMFESRPGFWSTGNLYLPDPLPEKCPAIFNTIGHWEPQRLNRDDTADYPQQLANFARMGFICLVTDMIGKVDSLQLTHDYGREEKELYTSNGLGVQLWNNIRALDLLCSMPEVDPENIGMTGASGGGSQTLFLSLLDERIKAAAPINMISLHFHGGCQCENAEGLRRSTDNAEMCAMIAPRALFLSGSTGDWTKYLESDELPAMMETYRQYNALSQVEYFYQDADHQYNEKTRHRVYSFFARHLMGHDPKWTEQALAPFDVNDLTWYHGQGHVPTEEDDAAFFDAHKKERIEKIAALSTEEKRRMLGWFTGLQHDCARLVPVSSQAAGGFRVERYVVLGNRGQRLPLVKCIPAQPNGRVCLALSNEGKACLDRPELQKLLTEGVTLVSADLFLTGEFGDAVREITGGDIGLRYFSTFHDTDNALRVQDAVLLIDAAAAMGDSLTLWADGNAARVGACALALTNKAAGAQLEEKSLELADDQDYYRNFFIPGLCALGGLKGCLELAQCPVKTF